MKKSLIMILALALGLISASYAGHNHRTISTRHTHAINNNSNLSMQQQVVGRSVLSVAQNNRRLSTWVAAIKAARLTSLLQRRGPITVFAPSNRTFSKLPRGTLQSLFQPSNRAKLRKILMYHIIKGRRLVSQIVKPGWYRTTQGKRIVITSRRGREYINGYARIRKTNIVARNGVIRVIDKVLIPPRS